MDHIIISKELGLELELPDNFNKYDIVTQITIINYLKQLNKI